MMILSHPKPLLNFEDVGLHQPSLVMMAIDYCCCRTLQQTHKKKKRHTQAEMYIFECSRATTVTYGKMSHGCNFAPLALCLPFFAAQRVVF